jgi:hypothetical protein
VGAQEGNGGVALKQLGGQHAAAAAGGGVGWAAVEGGCGGAGLVSGLSHLHSAKCEYGRQHQGAILPPPVPAMAVVRCRLMINGQHGDQRPAATDRRMGDAPRLQAHTLPELVPAVRRAVHNKYSSFSMF